MANLGFSLRSALGFIPKTEKIESQSEALKAELTKLKTYSESIELKEFEELQAYINSDTFKNEKKRILELNYKNTEEFKKEQNFNKLKKDKGILNYFKVLKSAELAVFNETELSDDLKEYLTLKEYTEGADFKNKTLEYKQNLKAEKDKAKELKTLEKSKNFKTYFKVLNSENLKNYTLLNESTELQEYEELKDFCTSSNLQKFKKAVAEQLVTEKNKVKDLKALKNNPIVKAYLKNTEKDTVDKPAEVTELEDLENYLSSQEYKTKLEELKYKNTEEYKKEEKFKTLHKSKKFKNYYKLINSEPFKHYDRFKDSDDLKHFEELKSYLASPEYQEALNNFTYTNSEEYKKAQKFEELKKSSKITNWVKYQTTKAFKGFKEVENSELLSEYLKLEEFINSDEFKQVKEYMLDKEKWHKTEDFQKESRYQELSKSDDVKWYFAVKDSNKFDGLKAWRLTFEEDFNTGKVEEEKWMNSYFWGKMLLNDRYVMAGDKQFYTDNKNIELNGTSLKIVTKKEKTQGKVWHPLHGFSTQEYNYTSGMLSTAHSFRQQYGKFEAKIKLNADYPVYQAFWLKGEKILPEIDVFKFNMDKKNRFQMSTIWGDANESKNAQRKTEKINGGNLSKDYFIYSLDWTEKSLTWKINGIEVFSTSEGLPNEPLYLLFSAGIQKEPSQDLASSAFEIDWVRCYEKV